MRIKLKVLDLFSGVGGLSFGLQQSGFNIVSAIEYDDSIARSMAKNHKDTKVITGDIRDLDPKIVKRKIGNIDLIVGGPPCQGFSLKGARRGLKDERNFLYVNFVNYLECFKPKYFIMENVPNILGQNNGFFKDKILDDFNKIGYIVDFDVLNAVDYGVPQNRKRAIFIGTKMKNKIILPVPNAHKKITVWDAISDLSYLESGEGAFESNYKYKAKTEYQKLMRKNSSKLYNHIATNHLNIALDRLKRIPPEKGKEFLNEKITSTFGQTWGRLEKNNQSPTIITRFDTPSNGKNSHPYLHRAITPREAARIQSFPDTFIFWGKKTSVIKQIGNAVPPLLGKALGAQIIKHYEKNR